MNIFRTFNVQDNRITKTMHDVALTTGQKIHFTSLGCSKNLVDSQVMLGHLGLDGFTISTEPENAEVIIVNTCSFVEAAKTESIETVLDLADFKDPEIGNCKALVMS